MEQQYLKGNDTENDWAVFVYGPGHTLDTGLNYCVCVLLASKRKKTMEMKVTMLGINSYLALGSAQLLHQLISKLTKSLGQGMKPKST